MRNFEVLDEELIFEIREHKKVICLFKDLCSYKYKTRSNHSHEQHEINVAARRAHLFTLQR